MNLIEHFHRNKNKYYITLICSVALMLSTKGITDETVISMNGDMPKYLMNGAFFYDFLKDFSFSNPVIYAYQYFARYPALSIGHHPILLGVAEVPFYALFGISVFSARLTVIFFLLLAAIVWFQFVKQVYDERVACISSLFLVTTPFIVSHSRIVMSEIPTLALIITTTYLFYQYCESDKKKYAYWSGVSLALSIYAKHQAIFLIPVLLLYLLIRKGPGRLVKKEMIYFYLISGLLLLPLLIITMKFSHANVQATIKWTSKAVAFKQQSNRYLYYIHALWNEHITLPALFLSAISFCLSVYRRDRRILIFSLWLICAYSLATLIGWKVSRYGIYWIPVFCLFASLTIHYIQHRFLKYFFLAILVLVTTYQFATAYQMKPEFTDGYEKAARYVIENKKGESVLFSSVRDTGYFIYFMRKYNPVHDLVILRANKILATSKMKWIVEDRIKKREEIYDVLNNYGTRYVVIDGTEYKKPPKRRRKERIPKALQWLKEEVETDKFKLVSTIILQSSEPDINNVPLSIYEYRDYSPPKTGQILRMNIPLMGDSIAVPLKALRNDPD